MLDYNSLVAHPSDIEVSVRIEVERDEDGCKIEGSMNPPLNSDVSDWKKFVTIIEKALGYTFPNGTYAFSSRDKLLNVHSLPEGIPEDRQKVLLRMTKCHLYRIRKELMHASSRLPDQDEISIAVFQILSHIFQTATMQAAAGKNIDLSTILIMPLSPAELCDETIYEKDGEWIKKAEVIFCGSAVYNFFQEKEPPYRFGIRLAVATNKAKYFCDWLLHELTLQFQRAIDKAFKEASEEGF